MTSHFFCLCSHWREIFPDDFIYTISAMHDLHSAMLPSSSGTLKCRICIFGGIVRYNRKYTR